MDEVQKQFERAHPPVETFFNKSDEELYRERQKLRKLEQKQQQESRKRLQEKQQENSKKHYEPQYFDPWLFLFAWQRVNNTPKLRLTAGIVRSRRDPDEEKMQPAIAYQSSDSLSLRESYQLSYTNFSQGGMSGGPVMDTLGRVIGIHAAAEGERSGLEEIQLGVSFGIPTKTVLSSISQAGIKPEWLKVEKVRPQRITKADEQSITKNLLEIEPPGNNGTEADWLNYGNDLWRIKRYQEAIVAFDEAIKRKPDFYQAYFGKSLVIQRQEGERFMQKDSEKMLPPPITFTEQSPAEFQQEMEQHRKKMAETITSLSQKTAKALPFLKKATEIKPDFYPAWKAIGMIKFGELNSQNIPDLPDVPDFSGKSKVTELNSNPPLSPKATQAAQEALAAFNKATALNPSDSYLYWSKGTVLQDLSRHQEAIEAYTEAIKINPTAIFYDSRSKSYCAIGYEQKAEADLRNAEKLGSQNPAKDLPFCGVVTNLKLDDLIKYGN
jgi:tetratricopeptide (TPR) repeat protein